MTSPPAGPNSLGAHDECATCSHARYLHHLPHADQASGQASTPCGRRQCACGGVFVELSYGTRMSRFVEAAQKTAASISTVRDALQVTMRATTELYSAMQLAGLLPEEEEPHLCDGCDRTDQPVTASPDGRALLCPNCQRIAAHAETIWTELRSTPALQQLATFHHVDCDRQNCDGTCTQGRDATPAIQTDPIPYPQRVMPSNSCSTCWPHPCRPGRLLCKRRQAAHTITPNQPNPTWNDLYGGPPQPEGDIMGSGSCCNPQGGGTGCICNPGCTCTCSGCACSPEHHPEQPREPS